MIVRRTLVFLLRKHRETATHLVLLFLLFSFFFSGVIMYRSTARYRDDALAQIGASLQISPATGTDTSGPVEIDLSVVSSIQNIPHVLGTDIAPPALEGACVPVGLKTVKTHTGFDPESQSPVVLTEKEARAQMDCVDLIGSSAIQLRNQFRKGLSVLSAGNFPTHEQPGVLVSRAFAENNSLGVGDSLKLRHLYSDQALVAKDVKVIGIYDTSLKFEVLKDNYMGVGVYKASPYNVVFADFDTASCILSRNESPQSVKIYVDSPHYLSEVQAMIQKLPLDWSYYQIYNETLSFYDEYASQINVVFANSLRLILLTSTLGIVLYLFIYSIWKNDRNRDIGIFMALGEKTKRILAQYLMEMIFLSTFAMLISIPASLFLIQILSRTQSPQCVSINAIHMRVPFYSGEFDVNPFFSVSIDVLSIVLLIAFALLISMLTYVTVFCQLKKNAFRTIFDEGE